MKKYCFLLLSLAFSGLSLAQALPLATPESQGISSKAISNFIEAANKSKNEFHSFVLIRHGKQIASGWWSPYARELKHTLYSTSKSFTSTAIGFAVQEKLLTVNDPVLSFFPEFKPDTISPNLGNMKVKDLLTMATGQYPEPIQIIATSDNWVKDFLKVAVPNEPGLKFNYNSMATYMLSAIIQKITGTKLLDYLKPRLFDPLGITEADWETNPAGINTGGWGLRLNTESMARFGQFYLDKGKWKGVQILNPSWIEEATTAQIHQWPEWVSPNTNQAESDWMQGYGYQFWRCRNNAYRADGAFGQYIVVLPEKNAVIAITCETSDMQDEINLVWNHLLPEFKNEPLAENPAAYADLQNQLNTLALPVAKSNVKRKELRKIKNQVFIPAENDEYLAFRLQPAGKNLRLIMDRKDGRYITSFSNTGWTKGETTFTGPSLLEAARNNHSGIGPLKTAGHFYKAADGSLVMQMRYIESPHTRTFRFNFESNANSVTITPSNNPRQSKTLVLIRSKN